MKFKYNYEKGRYSIIKMTCEVAAEDKYFHPNPCNRIDTDLYARINSDDILPYFLFKKYAKSNSVRIAFSSCADDPSLALKSYEGEKLFLRTTYYGGCFHCEALFLVNDVGDISRVYTPGYAGHPVPAIDDDADSILKIDSIYNIMDVD